MEQNPFERRLTLEQYVARAKEERSAAIAAFGRQVAAAIARIAAHLVRRRRPLATIPLDRTDLLTR